MRPSSIRSIALALAWALLLGWGCSPDDGAHSQDVATYSMRGLVIRPVEESAQGRVLWLRHEPVPDFVGIDGTVEGMEAMTMPFHLDDSIETSTWKAGARVAFDLTVDWSASVPGKITALQALPSETRLSFESTD